ncbi:hypothetical protein E2C01_016827 [Portunus trituberculatus]|uniref:DDE-1 domain-containing protein n=1 Tax=Portunus trituberculatus TaxID=210409 RepID=A0A5B7DR98_PORTR|nr:hypothetical protein [Portunus trituberculatus]
MYSSDETALYTQAAKQERHISGKNRVFIMCCTNAGDSHRLKSMIVVKVQKPHAIENVMDNMPVINKGNSLLIFRDNIKANLMLDSAQHIPVLIN